MNVGLIRMGRLAAAIAFAALQPASKAQIDRNNWGRIASPVYGTSETGVYAGAELFAGPNKFGSYFWGVAPNGKILKPWGTIAQIGMNPLGCALTPDGKYLVTSNDDERDQNMASLQSGVNLGGYSLSVVRTSDMTVVSQIATAGRFFVGLQITGSGPYTVWAAGGADHKLKTFQVSTVGTISTGPTLTIPVITAKDSGNVSHYERAATFTQPPGSPAGFSGTSDSFISYPAGMALSNDGRYLYMACNGDNSLAVVDTTTMAVVHQYPVGYFPYGVAVGSNGKVAVSNWGITEYKFLNPLYDGVGKLLSIGYLAGVPDGFYVVPTSTSGSNPKTSSVSLFSAEASTGGNLNFMKSIYMGQPNGIDALYNVGDTHPSALAVVHGSGGVDYLYVAKANDDSIGLINLNTNKRGNDFDLSPLRIKFADGHEVQGAYPNALAVSPDSSRVFVAEAGLNSVAVLDTTNPAAPKLIGRIPTGMYPSALAVSQDGSKLYVVNAKGVGEDINPNTGSNESFSDGNYIFGTVQRIDLASALPAVDKSTVLAYNYSKQDISDTSIVPIGGAASSKIKHVIFVLHENKTFDSVLGNLSGHFGPFASTNFNLANGAPQSNLQFTPLTPNIQNLAQTFATAANYYSDAEESDAGHQFCMSGTATDYTEKTLLGKTGRGMLVNKNFEPEDYPAGGYIFNNAARNGVNFKIFGIEAPRIAGSDTGTAIPTTIDDSPSGNAGVPKLTAGGAVTNPLVNLGDVESATQGFGHSFYMKIPGLAVLGANNPNGEARIDPNYPGYNFNISDQRRAKEFIKDFDRMVSAGTLPEFIYLYQPNDHTGGVQATNLNPKPTGPQLVADGDVGLGMALSHIMNSPIYYDAGTDTGAAIFITYDDAQSTQDHIHQHRTPLVVVSPFAKPGFVGTRHYSTASVVKTEELLLGLPPNNYGDLFATDLRDLFQTSYNGVQPSAIAFNRVARYQPTPEGRRIWALVDKLDVQGGPDRDSRRLGALNRLTMTADWWHNEAVSRNRLASSSYKKLQRRLYASAVGLVNSRHLGDD